MITKKIFSLWIAARLCDKGFKVISIEPNRDKPWMKVFTFENTEKFQIALTEILAKGRLDRRKADSSYINNQWDNFQLPCFILRATRVKRMGKLIKFRKSLFLKN